VFSQVTKAHEAHVTQHGSLPIFIVLLSAVAARVHHGEKPKAAPSFEETASDLRFCGA